jgi:hypothetical protein
LTRPMHEVSDLRGCCDCDCACACAARHRHAPSQAQRHWQKHYKMTPPFATHICVAKSLYMRWWGLYQRIIYVLPEVALQGSIATLIYVLVTLTNNRCKLATDIDGYCNAYMCLY